MTGRGRCQNLSSPDGVLDNQMQRDQALSADDRFMVAIDPYADGRTGYHFEANPAGAMADAGLRIDSVCQRPSVRSRLPLVRRHRRGRARGRCASHIRGYNPDMITDGIREFAARDWNAVRDAKDAYWAERVGRLGAAEGLRAADELRRQMLGLSPDWPDEEARRADLRFHADLSERLRRAGPARRG